ncbi:uncharacterized protein [Asterias amurensis]|uniref:uncharacterized protein n=1 Tax=Asterias amurensis TaxID=7602 RepID=UPI003AB2B77E
MEDGSALMWFRMLLWVCGLALVCSQDTTGPTATIKIFSEYTAMPREGDSVTLDCEISSIESTDDVLWSRRSSLYDPPTFIVNKNGLTAHADNRFFISPLQVVNITAALYSHKITIAPVQQSDQGYYQCFVLRNSATIAISTEIQSFVYHLDDFPVCFPDGPATVTIGSSLLCKTLSDTMIPTVFENGMPTTDGWVTSPRQVGGNPGQELTRTVTYSENDKTFHCFSTAVVTCTGTVLNCSIGPLTVFSESTNLPSTPKPTSELTDTTPITVQPSASKCQNFSSCIAVLIVSIVINLIFLILLFLCCRYDPRRWQQLQGKLSQSSSHRQETDRQNNLDLDYEVPSPEPKTMIPSAKTSPPETSEQLQGKLCQSSTPRQENNPHDNHPEVDYEVPAPEPHTPTRSTKTSPPETSQHVYHNKIAEPTSSSKQSDDSYMELNPPEQKPAVYSELKLFVGMEGGLALRWFRMLVWVCGLALVFSQDTTIPTATIKILPEYTAVPREGDSVTLDCEISSLQSTDVVLWSRRSRLSDTRRFIVDENGRNPALTDSRFSISPIQVVNITAALYSHKITIDPVQQSDQGHYQCFVLRGSNIITQSTVASLLVLPPDEFPVCTPDGPATVTIGSSLSCKTLSDTRMPSVSEMGMTTEADGWITSPTNAGGNQGQELTRTITNSEHGKTFHCFSISVSFITTTPICTIGPLTVFSESTNLPSTHKPTSELPDTTPITVQPSASKCQNCSSRIAVLIVSIVINLIFLILLFLCCRYDPRCWQQLQGKLSQSSSHRQETDRQNNLDLDYEVPSPEPKTMIPSAKTSPPETSVQLQGKLRQSSTPRQENDRHDNDPEVDYEDPAPEPHTPTRSTKTSPPETSQHVYNNKIAEPTSSSKQPDDSYMELNPPEQKPAVYSKLKL